IARALERRDGPGLGALGTASREQAGSRCRAGGPSLPRPRTNRAVVQAVHARLPPRQTAGRCCPRYRASTNLLVTLLLPWLRLPVSCPRKRFDLNGLILETKLLHSAQSFTPRPC